MTGADSLAQAGLTTGARSGIGTNVATHPTYSHRGQPGFALTALALAGSAYTVPQSRHRTVSASSN